MVRRWEQALGWPGRWGGQGGSREASAVWAWLLPSSFGSGQPGAGGCDAKGSFGATRLGGERGRKG